MDLSRKESYCRSKSTKSPSCIRIPGRPVRPVDVARPATRSRPVRPLAGTGQTGLFDLCQFWLSTYAPLFFGDGCIPKIKHLNQNCLRTMKNMHWPYFVLRAINSIGRILLLLQADDKTTCLGLHTCFMVADLAGITSTCCYIDSLRIRCSFLFWVWDKPEGHHPGCRYFKSCFMLFSHSLLQSMFFFIRLSLIGRCEAKLGYIGG